MWPVGTIDVDLASPLQAAAGDLQGLPPVAWLLLGAVAREARRVRLALDLDDRSPSAVGERELDGREAAVDGEDHGSAQV